MRWTCFFFAAAGLRQAGAFAVGELQKYQIFSHTAFRHVEHAGSHVVHTVFFFCALHDCPFCSESSNLKCCMFFVRHCFTIKCCPWWFCHPSEKRHISKQDSGGTIVEARTTGYWIGLPEALHTVCATKIHDLVDWQNSQTL